MTKFILPSLLMMVFSVTAFSQTILRTAQIQLNQNPSTHFGTYVIEVQIEKNQTGNGVQSNVYLAKYGDPEIANEGFYACEEQLSINGDVKMTYTMKNSAGQLIGRQTVSAELIWNHRGQTSNVEMTCGPQISWPIDGYFFHPDQYVSFKTPDGQVSVTAHFNVAVKGNQKYQASVDEKTLQRLSWFFENKTGGSTSLTDPAAPVESGDPYCSAHPYDCD